MVGDGPPVLGPLQEVVDARLEAAVARVALVGAVVERLAEQRHARSGVAGRPRPLAAESAQVGVHRLLLTLQVLHAHELHAHALLPLGGRRRTGGGGG